ncbi:site-specific tyrosine recombinase [Candidatus Scalindua japonica]|uniref:Site-specific tyrosine recombinase n=1 Tax=Candidatus Scalindua japonica TaxID=1284222 RepID=A0A286U2K4_9BACT|nr:site-specific integrase [Candidatus Scalindua japonica]GAX62368.1 site-specific tyrosine recombinase [Candidatus Scalindua japonica]
MFKRSGVWWACIRHNGRKIQKSLETSDKKLAKAIEAKIRTAIVEGKYYEKPIERDKTFAQLMDKFMKEHAPKVSDSMQRSYASYLKHLIPYFGDSTLLLVSRKKISGYKVLRKDEGARPATINRELAMVSKAFTLALEDWEWIDGNDKPFSKMSYEKENNVRDRWLTEEEEKRLLESSPGWLREIINFALNTGLRQDELLSLEWNRTNLFRKTILIKKTKNGKPKTVPLNRNAMEVIERKSEEKVRILKNDFVFVSSHGTKIDRHNLRRAFNNAVRRAEIEDFRFHDLRHCFCTKLAQRGVDIYKIAKLAGHEDIRMTQRYSHHCPESLRDGVEALEVDYNLTTMEEKRGF